MQLVPDPILATMMVIPFLVTFFALRAIIFVPLMKYMDERNNAVETANREAADITQQNEERVATVQEKLTAARADVAALRAEARARALESERHIIDEARLDAEERVDDAVLLIEKSRVAAADAMKQAATDLSVDIVGQILRPGAAAGGQS